MRRRAVALAGALLAGGCTLGPDYVRPPVDAPAAFRFAPKEQADTANLAWWTRFGDPVLDALIDEALANNRNVQVAVANVDQAAGVFTQVRSPLFPQLGYGASAARERASEAGRSPLVNDLVANPQNAYQAALSVTWELDLWGRIRRQSEAARANLLATDEARRGVILSVVGSVAGNYLQLRGLDAQLEVAKKTLGAYAESVKLFTLQFRYGQVSQMNVAQAQSQYETAAAQIPQIESQIAQVENGLSILLGRNPGPIERGKTIDQLVVPLIPADLPSALLQRRPDILQAEQNLVAANANVGATRALYYPSVSITGLLGSVSTAFSSLFTGPASAGLIAAGVSGPIFTFGGIEGQVSSAEAQNRQALLLYQQTILNAFRETNDALTGSQKKIEEVALQGKRVDALREFARLSKLRFDKGVAAYLDVLVAENELFAAELAGVRLLADRYTQLVSVYQAMGGGWVDIAASATPTPQSTLTAEAP